MLALHNAKRELHAAAPLKWDPALARAAAAAASNCPTSRDPSLARANIGENIYGAEWGAAAPAAAAGAAGAAPRGGQVAAAAAEAWYNEYFSGSKGDPGWKEKWVWAHDVPAGAGVARFTQVGGSAGGGGGGAGAGEEREGGRARAPRGAGWGTGGPRSPGRWARARGRRPASSCARSMPAIRPEPGQRRGAEQAGRLRTPMAARRSG
jgi:hypothetical protein